MVKDFLSYIKEQKLLSDSVIDVILPIIQEFYFKNQALGKMVYGDMGSFARGTNCDLTPDLDIGFFGASINETGGQTNWTQIGTRELTGKKEGITSIEELHGYDPVVQHIIQRICSLLDEKFDIPPQSTQFKWVRSWIGYPGWVCNLSLPHPDTGDIEIDLNLGYMPCHFGIEHAQRFNRYFNFVIADLGPNTAETLIEDIRWLKKRCKDLARDADDWIDRSKKVAGFVIEGLFMHQYPPHTRSELMDLIIDHKWKPGQRPTDHWIGDQKNQIIDAGYNFTDLIINLAVTNDSFPLGAWEILHRISQEIQS